MKGVWYVAADRNADPKIFLQSAVIEFTPNETELSFLEIVLFLMQHL